MKTKTIHLFTVMVLALLALDHQAHCATLTWTNTSGGNWSNTNNWSPHQIPTNTDTTLITMPGTYTVIFDLSGGVYPSIVSNLTVGAGINASGTQTLVITNLSPYSIFEVNNWLLVTNGGVLNVTNGTIEANPLTIDKGGNFNGSNEDVYANVTVANGGLMSSVAGRFEEIQGQASYPNQTLILTNGGTLNSFDDTIGGTLIVASGGVASVRGVTADLGFLVQHGGTLNLGASAGASYGASLIVDSSSTNYGTINMTNGNFLAAYGPSLGGYLYGSFVNGPGGVFNLFGYGGVYSGSSLLNQGAIMQASGSNWVIGLPFDTSSGTVSNLSSVLSLGYESNLLAGTYYTAPNTSIQLQGVDVANGTSTAQLVLGTPLVLAGNGQYQLTSGYLYLSANVPTNLELQCDSVTVGPGFQSGAITNLLLAGTPPQDIKLFSSLPVTGVLTMTNCFVSTNLVVANGGLLTAASSSIMAGLAVAGGGVASLNQVNLGGIQIAHGGTINAAGAGIIFYGGLTNAGTLNLAGPVSYVSEILNLAGGLINLASNAIVIATYPTTAFVNQGIVLQNAGTGATNRISYGLYGSFAPFAFDTSQGTITNLSGTLILPNFANTLSGTFFAAAGATISLGGGTTNTPLVAGTPLVMGGPGIVQFGSGYLYLPATTIPNLSLAGGQLELGPAFQGGAITNLTLNGIALTNQFSTTLPITGKFTVLNSGGAGSLNTAFALGGLFGNGVYGNYTVADGGILTASNAILNGGVTVASGGVFNAESGSYIDGSISVAGGGTLNVSEDPTLNAVTVASGAVFNSLDSYYPQTGRFGPSSTLYGPLTNFGTINLTNSGMTLANDGIYDFGCLINQAGGQINFRGSTGIYGYGGDDYLFNEGRIVSTSIGYSGFGIDLATNAGTITAQAGSMILGNQWTLLPSGSLNVVLNSATNYGSFIFSAGGLTTGTAALAGAFNATLNNGYVPTNGTTFNVLTYGSFTGSFSSLGLPAAVTWQSNYGSTNFSLVAGSELPQFGIVNLLGTNLIFNGTGGPAGSNYVMLASTNLALALTNWTALTTNTFDGTGQFRYTNHVSPAKPRQFFIFKLP